jgi:LPS-assembly protein
LRQTLEPRLHYVNTPWRDQSTLPLFDTAASDFNAVSIYADNPFSGIDRVADAHQVTLGATTRWQEPDTGVERLRLGVAQRFLFRDQRLTPDEVPGNQRVSDLLLFGSGSLWQNWIFDTSVQYGAAIDKPVRSIVAVRYQPAPFHTLAGTYRYARDLSEQFELGWQWPIYRSDAKAGGSACQGTLYGVGRVNFSMRDNRVTDALAGVEYDAGCWIGRFVVQKVSTGASESTTHWMLQLELIGLSRLGSNPLKVLKDNIPGYQLLRDDDAAPSLQTPTP